MLIFFRPTPAPTGGTRGTTAQEEERSRIGRELHDHVSQRLGLLAIRIDELRLNSSATTAGALEELRRQTSEITDDIHALSHRLHSSMLDHLGVVPALQRLVKECSQRYAVPIAFTHAPLPGLSRQSRPVPLPRHRDLDNTYDPGGRLGQIALRLNW